MLNNSNTQLNDFGKRLSELPQIKLNTDSFSTSFLLNQMAYSFLLDLHKWEKTEFTPEEIERVKRDFLLRIEQVLPQLLLDNHLFTIDTLAVYGIPKVKATFWQKLKLVFKILLK